MAVFQSFGNSPVARQRFNSVVSGVASDDPSFLSNRALSPSGPDEVVLGSRDIRELISSSLTTKVGSTEAGLIDRGVRNGVSRVKTEQKYSLSVEALASSVEATGPPGVRSGGISDRNCILSVMKW